jgi:hypothetical protein
LLLLLLDLTLFSWQKLAACVIGFTNTTSQVKYPGTILKKEL